MGWKDARDVRPATGGSEPEQRDERDWILRCESFRVYGPEGYIGVVVAVAYDHSARWDAPHGLRVRRPDGSDSIVLLPSIVEVDVEAGRIIVVEGSSPHP